MGKYLLWPLPLIPIEHRGLVRRRRLYKAMRKHTLISGRGFCFTMLDITGTSPPSIESLPELMKYKPQEGDMYCESYTNLWYQSPEGVYWFPLNNEGKKRRLEILDEIISKL